MGIRDLPLSDVATTDPFSGNPLIMKQTAQGWVIYSVFENGTDDMPISRIGRIWVGGRRVIRTGKFGLQLMVNYG